MCCATASRKPGPGPARQRLSAYFLTFNLIAQFKAGGLIMRRASEGVRETSVYQAARGASAEVLTATGAWHEADARRSQGSLYDIAYPDYVLGILIFALTVVAYTAYGGFLGGDLDGRLARPWSSWPGPLLLMVFALIRVGGLEAATTRLQAVNPELVTAPGPDAFFAAEPGRVLLFPVDDRLDGPAGRHGAADGLPGHTDACGGRCS